MQLWKSVASACRSLFSSARHITPPDGVQVVENFDINRYLGAWYEIARFDHRFERDLEQVTATYSLRDDGGIRVVNRGFNSLRRHWRESVGKGYFTGSPQRAALRVSFFGPFYAGYNVIELDKDYRYALVCGPDRDYLWILSRTPTLDSAVRQRLVDKAQRDGFATHNFIMVKQPAGEPEDGVAP